MLSMHDPVCSAWEILFGQAVFLCPSKHNHWRQIKKISISDITALFLSSSFVITTDCMETNVTSAGREESDPSPMGYGRRGAAAGGAAWRQNGGGGAQAPGSQQRYVQPWPKRTSMVWQLYSKSQYLLFRSIDPKHPLHPPVKYAISLYTV